MSTPASAKCPTASIFYKDVCTHGPKTPRIVPKRRAPAGYEGPYRTWRRRRLQALCWRLQT
jgi:hypothetical protein